MRRKILRAVRAVLALLVLGALGFYVYVHLTYQRDFMATPRPAVQASKEPDVIKRGEYLAHAVAHCSACHGPAEQASARKLAANLHDLRGGYVLKAGPFGTFYPANLTPDPETGLGKLTDGDVARVIRHAVAPDGRLDPLMRFAVGPMADEDLVALLSYLRSIPPIPNATSKDEWGFVAKALSSKFTPNMRQAPSFVREGGASKERGEYLANGPALCGGCHSPYDMVNGYTLAGAAFSGALKPDPDPTESGFELMPPNLTPDKETGVLSNYTEDGFIDRFKKGGRVHQGSKMPWDNFALMTDDDLRSLYRYLQSLPPTKRSVGPTRRARGSFKG
jgi:cytochrome c553